MLKSNHGPRTRKPKRVYFSKSPDELVADYIFSDEHEDSDIFWIIRKLDRYNKSSNYTSSEGIPFDFRRLEETLTSKFKANNNSDELESPTCKQQLFGKEDASSMTPVAMVTDRELERLLVEGEEGYPIEIVGKTITGMLTFCADLC